MNNDTFGKNLSNVTHYPSFKTDDSPNSSFSLKNSLKYPLKQAH